MTLSIYLVFNELIYNIYIIYIQTRNEGKLLQLKVDSIRFIDSMPFLQRALANFSTDLTLSTSLGRAMDTAYRITMDCQSTLEALVYCVKVMWSATGRGAKKKNCCDLALFVDDLRLPPQKFCNVLTKSKPNFVR